MERTRCHIQPGTVAILILINRIVIFFLYKTRLEIQSTMNENGSMMSVFFWCKNTFLKYMELGGKNDQLFYASEMLTTQCRSIITYYNMYTYTFNK